MTDIRRRKHPHCCYRYSSSGRNTVLVMIPSMIILGVVLALMIMSNRVTTALMMLPMITRSSSISKHRRHRHHFHSNYSILSHCLPNTYFTTTTTTTILRASISSDETSSFTQQQQQTSPPSSATTSSSNNGINKKPTLYDILGASPTATRTELKRKYVALAKMTHPDTQPQRSNGSSGDESKTTTTTTTSPYDFNDIATAYKILSDDKQRRRYDRSIKAEVLTEQIAFAVQNHPITELTIKAIGTIAVPFFRTMNKVTSTSSSLQHQQQQLQSSSSTSSKYSTKVPDSNQRRIASRSVHELEQQTQYEYDRLVQLRQQLQQVTEERIRMALYTPQSGLNSNEAYAILNSFSTATSTPTGSSSSSSSSSSWVERLNFLRSSVQAEIHTLQNSEQTFIQQQQMNTRAQTIHQSMIHDQFMIRQNLVAAERTEQEARRSLDRAIENTRQQRYQYERLSEEVFAAENAAVHASNELERIQHIIQKQSENVRHALIRKERALIHNHNNHRKSDDNHNNNDEMEHQKPEPPMSPLSTASSSSSLPNKVRSSYSTVSEPSSSSSSFMESTTESSQYGAMAWSNQPQSPTTSDQQQNDSNNIMMSSMGFVSGDGATNLDDKSNNNMDELMILRQQEYEMTIMIQEMESHIQSLVGQMNAQK